MRLSLDNKLNLILILVIITGALQRYGIGKSQNYSTGNRARSWF